MAEADEFPEALGGGWARLDGCVLFVGVIVGHVGVVAQAAGFVLAFVSGDPIAGEMRLVRGFWLAGLGGARMVYGNLMNSGGPVPQSGHQPGTPPTEIPPPRRRTAALWALGLTPAWGVLSLPIAVVVYGLLVVVGSVCGLVLLVRWGLGRN